MGERKVLNKYFPPDFDPEKLPAQRGANNKSKKPTKPDLVRMMMPMTVRCLTCGEFIYKGKKFNARKEDVKGPDGNYLGIKVFRFYFKCPQCSAEFTIRTDPKNMDYACESGAKRNFDVHKDAAEQKATTLAERKESDESGKMAQLENKTKDSKMEMDILDGLGDIRAQNSRNARVDLDSLIAQRRQSALRSADSATGSNNGFDDEVRAFAEQRVKRLVDGGGGGSGGPSGEVGTQPRSAAFGKELPTAKRLKLPTCIVQPKSAKGFAAPEPTSRAQRAAEPAELARGALLGLGAYGSDESSEDECDQDGNDSVLLT